jgi:HEAT repeat protein
MGELVCRHCGYNPVIGKRAADRLADQEAGIPAPPLTRRRRTNTEWMYGPGHWDSADTFALNLTLFGIGACVLPLFGLQWRPLILLGAYAAWVGLFLGLGGSALYSMRQRFGLGALAGMLALAAFGVSMRFSPPPEDDTLADDRDPTTVTSSSSSSNQSTQAPPPPPPVDEVLTLLSGPPAKADPVTWHAQHLNHSDLRVRHKCAKWLAASTPDKHKSLVARAFEPRLADESAEIRRLAVAGLAFAPDDRTVNLLLPLLDDRDPAVRSDVYKLLAKLKDARAITPVVHRLADHGPPAREAFDALAKEPAYADPITRAFESALTHQNTRMKILAAEELARWKGAGTVDTLIETLASESDAAVRRAMISTLARLKDPRAIPPLVNRLREDREPASEALTAFGPAAEKALIGVLKATANDKEVRLAACRILKTVGTKESVTVLRGTAADPDSDISLAAVEAWQKIDPDSLTPLVASIVDMQSTDPARHRAGLERLAEAKFDKTQQEEVARLLLKFVTHADESIRRPALVVLPAWATDATVKALLKLEDEKAEQLARRHAHTALGTLKDRKDAKQFALAIVKFVDVDRPEAAEALVALGPVAEPVVIEHLLYHKDSDEMILVGVNILGEIGLKTSRAIPELQKLILDKPDTFREPALRAIDSIRSRPLTPLRKPATQP